MKIRFIGLIAHVRNNAGEFLAVLIDEKDHRPKLIYTKQDLSGVADDPANDIVQCEKLKDTFVKTDLAGAVIDRVNLAGVPKMGNVGGSGKNLHKDIDKAHNNVPGRFTSVMLLNGDPVRGATYYVEEWFEDHATFGGMLGANAEICLPQVVVLDIPTEKDVTFTITATGGATTLKFKPVASVTITNAEEKVGAANHFDLFGNLFEDKAGGGLVVIQGPGPTGRSCTHGASSVSIPDCGGGQTVGVECSNSQYP